MPAKKKSTKTKKTAAAVKKASKASKKGRKIVRAVAAASAPEATRPSQLSVPELKALYREVVGRDTDSEDKAYLLWKIREAKKGRIRVGPALVRKGNGPAKILPVRIGAEDVEALDEVWKRHGVRSRMEFFRRALHRELTSLGEEETAARFSGPEGA